MTLHLSGGNVTHTPVAMVTFCLKLKQKKKKKLKQATCLFPRAVFRNLACVFITSQSSDTRIAVVKMNSTDGNASHALLC